MNERATRIGAIVRADFLIRFRRLSTVVIFLLLSASVYFWVPASSTGRTLLQINGRRAIYNSAAIGMGTALLGAVFIGLVGFYVVSNAIRRDLDTRCGFVMAATAMRSSEYIIGKALGNILFLSTFMSGYMLTGMGMQLVRGEAALQPLIFIGQYLLIVPPAIVFVSVIAIVFESIPWLSGRVGDVLYFFLWASMSSIVVVMRSRGAHGPTFGSYFDLTAMDFTIEQMRYLLHTTEISIGASDFDAAKPVMVFQGLSLTNGWAMPRIISTLMPLPLLAVARLFFHRFDPARVKAATGKEGRGWLPRINAALKPLARPFAAMTSISSESSLLRSAWADAALTFTVRPVLLLLAAGLGFAALVNTSAHVATRVFPIAFALVAVVLSDVASRDRSAQTAGLIHAAPRLQQNFVLWKLGSTLFAATVLLSFPIARFGLHHTHALPALAIGVLFVCCASVAFAVISGNPKTFVVLFLSFWYVVINDSGHKPVLDFAGFYGTSTLPVVAMYATIGAVLMMSAMAVHRYRTA